MSLKTDIDHIAADLDKATKLLKEANEHLNEDRFDYAQSCVMNAANYISYAKRKLA